MGYDYETRRGFLQGVGHLAKNAILLSVVPGMTGIVSAGEKLLWTPDEMPLVISPTDVEGTLHGAHGMVTMELTVTREFEGRREVLVREMTVPQRGILWVNHDPVGIPLSEKQTMVGLSIKPAILNKTNGHVSWPDLFR